MIPFRTKHRILKENLFFTPIAMYRIELSLGVDSTLFNLY